ncbi:MAG: alpha-E domain-containing protein [Pseudomonadota bacterium]
MLSSVAENIYWMSRYIERAESIARVVGVNANLQLDLPRGLKPDWRPLIDVMGANDSFEARHRDYSERQVVRFLLGEPDSPSSVRSCVHFARESCRTVRDCLPREVWQYLTELQLFIDEDLDRGLTRAGRYGFTERIIRTCQMISGLLGSVMTRDIGYQFFRLGRNLERADMTTRFIDMRLVVTQFDKLPDPAMVMTVQWVNVLNSLSAYHMYRRKMQTQVLEDQALWFLLKDDEFPRSFIHCINAIEESLGTLVDPQPCLMAARKVLKTVDQAKVESLKIGALVDSLQRGLMEIHASVARMYFLPAPAP